METVVRLARLKAHLAQVLDYLEEDEREDFLALGPKEAQGHIYPVVAAARAEMLRPAQEDLLKLYAAIICDYLEPREKQHADNGVVTVRAFDVMRHIYHVRRCLERES